MKENYFDKQFTKKIRKDSFYRVFKKSFTSYNTNFVKYLTNTLQEIKNSVEYICEKVNKDLLTNIKYIGGIPWLIKKYHLKTNC